MKTRRTSAFTLIEMLVVIAIIATIAAFAVPALTNAMTKGQMTGTMNNARQLYLAGYQMALDGGTNSDANRAWPGDYATVPSLAQYCVKLVGTDYLKAGDIQKVLSAPGAACTVASDGTPSGGKSGLKVYLVKDSDASNVIFAVSANYVYDTALDNTSPTPYGEKGFIVVRKGGDGAVLRKDNATATVGQEATFEGLVGKKPGEAQGTVTAGDPSNTLKYP